MLYVLVLDGPSARTAKPVVATRDPRIVQVVADAITARLNPALTLVKPQPARSIHHVLAEADHIGLAPDEDNKHR
jgi:hypothetical protein